MMPGYLLIWDDDRVAGVTTNRDQIASQIVHNTQLRTKLDRQLESARMGHSLLAPFGLFTVRGRWLIAV